MAGRNFWVAVAAIGTLLGGAAALVAVMKPEAGPKQQVASPTPAAAPSYSEAIWCAAEARHVEIPIGWLSRRGVAVPVTVQRATVQIATIEERAHALAIRLAASQGKTAMDVESDLAQMGLTITLRDYDGAQQEEHASILTRKVETAVRQCDAFLRS